MSSTLAALAGINWQLSLPSGANMLYILVNYGIKLPGGIKKQTKKVYFCFNK